LTNPAAPGSGAEEAAGLDPEAYLASFHPLGWRFGLDRIQRLVSALGMPQHRFASIHVVGTNGKSSVATIASALLEAHGTSTGTYLSPHDERWSERVLIGGDEIGASEFAAAVERVADAVEVVNRGLEEGESVTQFEAATAAAFVALAAAGVEVGVIEAGLGGRLDATNVLPSRVTALTSIGLEHTQWLGDTEEEIAGEKLAVLRDHSTLVLGEVSPGVEALALATARERHALLVRPAPLPAGLGLAQRAPYLQRDFAVAVAAATELVGALELARMQEVARSLHLPGRMEVHPGDPGVILDAAHNPDGARAVAEALPRAAGARPVIACIAVLADKDVSGIATALAGAVDAAVVTEIPSDALARAGRSITRSRPASELVEAMSAAGIAPVETVEDPARAVERTLALARDRSGVALIAGSHYLLPYGEAALRASARPG
jgi:dihydrofolate synthase / folylpolyglutamate synthase